MAKAPTLAVARAVGPAAAGNAANTAGPRTLRLRFQQWPGLDGAGIEGLPCEVDGTRVTPAGGDLDISVPRGGSAVVRLMDPGNPSKAIAEYTVRHRQNLPSLDPLAPAGTKDLPGLRCRLNMLGYNTGKEDLAKLDAMLERALLQFEADQPSLPVEGVLQRLPDADVHSGVVPGMELRPASLQKLDSELRSAGQAPATSPPGIGPLAQTGSGAVFHNRARGKAVFDMERVVLVSVDRATPPAGAAFARAEFPYVDDRGFRPETRLFDVQGPAVSMAENSRIRLKLIREDLFADAPIYVRASTVIVTPEVQQLPTGSEAEFDITSGTVGGGHHSVVLNFHLGKRPPKGDPDGPLIHRMSLTVFETVKVPVSAFAVDLGTKVVTESVTTTEQEVRDALADVNDIWAQAGVEFVLKEFSKINAVGTKFRAATGAKAEEISRENVSKLIITANEHRDRRINMYIVKDPNTLGVPALAAGFPTPATLAAAGHPLDGLQADVGAILVRAGTLTNSTERGVLAHEIGHYLGLGHVADSLRKMSIWDLRRLQYWITSTIQPGWQPQLDPKARSFHLTVKDLGNVNEDDGTGNNTWHNDGEVWRVREELDSDRWFAGLPSPTDPICTFDEASDGSASDEKQLAVLRDFRDRNLAPYAIGRAVIRAYYACAPLLARRQRRHAWLNPPVRMAMSLLVGGLQTWRRQARACRPAPVAIPA